MERRFARKGLFLGSLGITAILLWGCGGGDNTATIPGNTDTTSRVRTLNTYIPATGSNGTLNVSAGNTSLSGQSGLGFGQISPTSGYTNVTSGAFNPMATGQGITTPIQSQSPLTLTGNNTSYTVAVAGQSGQTGTLAPQILTIPGYTNSLPTIPTGQAAIRVINLAPGFGPYSLYNNTNPGGQSGLVNTSLSNIGYGFNPTTNGYISAPINTLGNLGIQTIANPGQNISFANNTLATQQFQSGQAYTIYTIGQTGNISQPLDTVITQDNL